VLSVSIDRNYVDLVESCGYYWVLNDVCFASERPRCINLDERGRLHSDAGQSIGYPSGWGLYHFHGVAVPRNVIEAPETITLEMIEAQSNIEVQRVMIERFGWDRYAAECGAQLIDHDERWGSLFSKQPLSMGEPILFLRAVNRSPEPDGTFRRYILPVDPDCRPLPDPEERDAEFGEPQTRTALNAAASTFGMRGADYARVLGAES
jgi:hypothetical protein